MILSGLFIRVLIICALLINPIRAILPFFELPINDQADCVDFSHDCVEKRALCKSKAFEDVMRQKCAKTCKICSEVEDQTPELIDRPIQRHSGGRPSKPPFREWRKFMTHHTEDEFEEKHHGYERNLDKNVDRETEDYGANSEELFLSESSEHQSSTIMPPSAILQPPPSFPLSPDHGGISAYRRRRTCLDHAPNCFYLRSLCNNNFYIPIMRKNCEKTCNFCPPMGRRTTHERVKWRGRGKQPQQWLINGPIQTELCRDRGLDCDEKINYCTHWRYWKFMRRICPLSCGFCDTNNENDY